MAKKIKFNTETNLIFSQREMLRELEKRCGRRALERVLGRRVTTITRSAARSHNGAVYLVDVMPELNDEEHDAVRDLLYDCTPQNLNLALMALAVKKGEGEGTT